MKTVISVKEIEELIAKGGENVDWDRASAALQRALVRIQVVSKHQGINIATVR